MKRLFLFINLIFCLLVSATVSAKKATEEVNAQAFELLNLDYPGLETVKAQYKKGKLKKAAEALLTYYRERKGIVNPDIDLNKISISKNDQKWADDALEHTFFAHKGYQPSYNYGKDINWKYWPVKDNEAPLAVTSPTVVHPYGQGLSENQGREICHRMERGISRLD